MMNDVSKALLEKLEKANYATNGIAKLSLTEYSNVDEVKAAVLEIEKIPENEQLKFDFNEGTMELNVYNPEEDIDGFEVRHPNRQKCSNN